MILANVRERGIFQITISENKENRQKRKNDSKSSYTCISKNRLNCIYTSFIRWWYLKPPGNLWVPWILNCGRHLLAICRAFLYLEKLAARIPTTHKG